MNLHIRLQSLIRSAFFFIPSSCEQNPTQFSNMIESSFLVQKSSTVNLACGKQSSWQSAILRSMCLIVCRPFSTRDLACVDVKARTMQNDSLPWPQQENIVLTPGTEFKRSSRGRSSKSTSPGYSRDIMSFLLACSAVQQSVVLFARVFLSWCFFSKVAFVMQ